MPAKTNTEKIDDALQTLAALTARIVFLEESSKGFGDSVSDLNQELREIRKQLAEAASE